MNRQLLFIVNVILLNVVIVSVLPQTGTYNGLVVSDGPYIFNQDGEFKICVIRNNSLKEDFLVQDNFNEFKSRYRLLFEFKDLSENYLQKPNNRQVYRKVDSIGIISDIHGEYNTYISLLKAMGIIDKNLSWKFGKGHLVILGDIFDRGDMVTEVLWHIYGLEKQALKAGGMVHLLLGNHEMMLFDHDLRYLSDKYRKVEEVTGKSYSDLFSYNSVLGRWLRSRPVIISINDILFLHAGISMEMVHRFIGLARANLIISNMLAGKGTESDPENEELDFLTDDQGPLWYRGYFTDLNFGEGKLDSILKFYGKRHIVVGHTPIKEIKSFYGSKILGIDSGIGEGERGEMLVIKDGFFYRGNTSGKRTRLQTAR